MPAPRTPGEMIKILVGKLHERTGRTMDQWIEVARGSGIGTHKALTEWMKTEHGLNHNEAQWVAWGVIDPDRLDAYERPADLEDELYASKKAHLRPVYERLMEAGKGLGDVKPTVCKTYTSLAAGTQFVLFAPRTNNAVDVELVLPPGWSGEGVEPFKSANPKFTHRIRVSAPEQVDARVVDAMRAAMAYVRK